MAVYEKTSRKALWILGLEGLRELLIDHVTIDDGDVRPLQGPGKVQALFVMHSEPPFGCLQTLTATADLSGRGHGAYLMHVGPSGIDDSFKEALWAAHLALRHVLSLQGLDARGEGAFHTYDFAMELQDQWRDYEGGSIGLSAAIAILSSLTGRSIPSNTAFTGRLMIDSEVKPVSGIEDKVDAAIDKGTTRIYVPSDNLLDVPAAHRQAVIGVRNLADVISQIFDPDHIQTSIARLNRSPLSAARQAEMFARKARGGEKVLISCVGNRDPFGAPVHSPSEQAEGAILTAFRHVRPRAVCLLGTHDLSRQLELTKDFLDAIVHPSQCLTVTESLVVSDPTIYDDLADDIGKKLKLLLDDMSHAIGQQHGIEPYLVVSSGTPQMQAVWVHLLQTEPSLQGAHVLQVREPRFVQAGEERVREVVSRHLRIGVA